MLVLFVEIFEYTMSKAMQIERKEENGLNLEAKRDNRKYLPKFQ